MGEGGGGDIGMRPTRGRLKRWGLGKLLVSCLVTRLVTCPVTTSDECLVLCRVTSWDKYLIDVWLISGHETHHSHGHMPCHK